MKFEAEEVTERLLREDATLFVGDTASHSLGWVHHVQRYLGSWLDETAKSLPVNTGKTFLFGMGGSSSPARFYAEAKGNSSLRVLDTSSPDSIRGCTFDDCVVIASSKSGTTIETQALLAHALANGLKVENLVIITDPGTSLGELGESIGARVVEGDPCTGGRFSALSPFGLIPALYGGWSVDALRDELARNKLTAELVQAAWAQATDLVCESTQALFPLPSDPLSSGSALWLEQLIAETTGKAGRGLIPYWNGGSSPLQPSSILFWHLVASFAADLLGVDPFNQPNVEIAKKNVLMTLGTNDFTIHDFGDSVQLIRSFESASVRELNIYCPIEAYSQVSSLRTVVTSKFGATSANIGPRYLHSTGQLFKGGPTIMATLQVVVRPKGQPQRISGRRFSFHDLFLAQALCDFEAMRGEDRAIWLLVVDDLSEVEHFFVDRTSV